MGVLVNSLDRRDTPCVIHAKKKLCRHAVVFGTQLHMVSRMVVPKVYDRRLVCLCSLTCRSLLRTQIVTHRIVEMHVRPQDQDRRLAFRCSLAVLILLRTQHLQLRIVEGHGRPQGRDSRFAFRCSLILATLLWTNLPFGKECP